MDFSFKIKKPKLPDNFTDMFLSPMQKYMKEARTTTKNRFMSGMSDNRLATKTGALKRSLTYSVKERQDSLVGTMKSSSIYAPVHEFGGTIHPRGYPIKIKKRSFMYPGLISGVDRFEKLIFESVQKGWDK